MSVTGDICQGSAQKEGEYTRHLVWAVRGSALGVVTGDICQGNAQKEGEYTSTWCRHSLDKCALCGNRGAFVKGLPRPGGCVHRHLV